MNHCHSPARNQVILGRSPILIIIYNYIVVKSVYFTQKVSPSHHFGPIMATGNVTRIPLLINSHWTLFMGTNPFRNPMTTFFLTFQHPRPIHPILSPFSLIKSINVATVTGQQITIANWDKMPHCSPKKTRLIMITEWTYFRTKRVLVIVWFENPIELVPILF